MRYFGRSPQSGQWYLKGFRWLQVSLINIIGIVAQVQVLVR